MNFSEIAADIVDESFLSNIITNIFFSRIVVHESIQQAFASSETSSYYHFSLDEMEKDQKDLQQKYDDLLGFCGFHYFIHFCLVLWTENQCKFN